MAETSIPTPEAIEVERTKVEEVSQNKVESARRILSILIVFAILNAVILAAFWRFSPPGGMIFLVTAELVVAAFVLSFATIQLRQAQRNQHKYATRTRISWTVRCCDIYHTWNVEGWGPCEGWRDVRIQCMKLPGRRGKWLAVPRLRVFVDNGEHVLATKEIGAGEDSGGLRFTDTFGKPLRVMLCQDNPDEASLDQAWEVEITVESDPNPPETLTATPLASGEVP